MTRTPYEQWPYSVEYTIANAPTVDGYQHTFTVSFKPGMRADFRDLRFRDPATLKRCDYYPQSYTAGVSAVVVVELYQGQTRLEVLFGNGAAVSESSLSSVFLDGDDFNRADSTTIGNGWTEDVAIYSIASNELKADGAGGTTGNGLRRDYTLATGQVVEWRVKAGTTSASTLHVFSAYGPSANRRMSVAFYNSKIQYLNGSGWQQLAASYSTSTYYTIRIRYDGTSWAAQVDDSAWVTGISFYTDAQTNRILSFVYGATSDAYIDYLYVRKHLATPPTLTRARSGPNPWGLAVRRFRAISSGPPPIVAEIGRSLALEAGTTLESTITAETGRSLTPFADAYEPATEIIAEIGRSLTLTATAPLETAITAELARALGLAATAPLTTTTTAELARALGLAATAPLTTTTTAELARSLDLTPPRTTYWYNFDGVKWISSTVRRSITDHFHQLDEEISGAEELPIDFLRQAKVIAQDLHGTSRCIFYGMLPGINQKISWRNDSTTIKGYDHGWRLSDQKVPAARRVISPTVDPRDVVLEFLGGDRWETKTEVRPYRIAPLTAYGTEAMPAHQWEFSPETSCMEAIREFDEKCDRIFLVKWMQIGNAISVDNPDPSRRLMRVEAEDFDPGGEGVGYHDVDTRNLGGAYRSGEGVDVENTPGEGGRNVGWIRDGEWLDFTREFAWAGSYAFSARVAAAAKATPAYFKVYLDGVYQFRINVGAAPTSDAGYRTGSYQVFTNTVPDRLTSTSGVVLADAPQYLEIPTTGDHVIRLEFWGNTENITPSVMHQNIARFDLSPQGGSEIDPNDVRYQSIAYWVDEAKIDSPTEGLDLPPPLTISDPGRWPKDGTIKITKQARQRYNRVIVRGHSASGVWFEATAQTAAVAAGEPPSEYLETNDRVTPATIQGYANALLAYYQLDQRSYSCTLMQRMDLEIYQKIRFTDHPQLPSAWCRITSTEKRVDGKADSCTITFVPEQTLAAQRRLQRMLRPTNTSAITDVVRSEIARQSEVWVGTCAEIVDDDTATFTLEQGGTSRGRIAPDG